MLFYGSDRRVAAGRRDPARGAAGPDLSRTPAWCRAFPTAILVTGMVIVAVLCFFAGLILDTVTRGRREMRRLAYLSLAAPGEL